MILDPTLNIKRINIIMKLNTTNKTIDNIRTVMEWNPIPLIIIY